MANKVLLFLFVFSGCNKSPETEGAQGLEKNLHRDALFYAAIENGFSLDQQIKNKLENQRRRVLGKLYIESAVNNRVSVPMGEVEEYYNKTKGQFLRQQREFLVLKFVAPTLDSARGLHKKLRLATQGGSGDGLGGLIAQHNPSRELIEETKLKKTIRNQFLRGGDRTVGPVSYQNQHNVFHLLRTYEEGTTQEQIHIEEKLRNRLFAMKAQVLRKNIIDSLKSKHAGLK